MSQIHSSSSDRSPMFIVGPPRSGTTLLKEILNRHPDIFIIHETHFMEMVYPLRDRLDPGNPSDRSELVDQIMDTLRTNLEHDEDALPFQQEQLLSFLDDHPPTSYRDLFRCLFDLGCQNHGSRIGGDKTPRHLFHIDKLLEWFPDADVFILVRDGRDFLTSYKYYSKRENVSRRERERIASLYHPITTSIMWRSTANVYLSREDDPRVHPVRFERLVTKPDETVRKLLESIDLEYDPDMLQVEAANTSFDGDGKSRGIQEAPIRRWEDRLTDGERFWFRLINHDVMFDLGYVMNGRGGFFEGLLYVFTFPWQVVRALWKNRHRTKNLWSYLWKRLNPG